MTYSVLHFDRKDKKIISGICSNWIGIQVCRVIGKSGVVHTQSWADYQIAHTILDSLDDGATPDQAINEAIKQDAHANIRQLLVCDMQGRMGVYSGSQCVDTYWHVRGKNTVAAGNMLSSKRVIQDLIANITYTSEARPELAVFNAMKAVHVAAEGEADKRGDRSLSLKSIPADYRTVTEYQLDVTRDSAMAGERIYDELEACIQAHFERDNTILK